jgi:hypothetical protein
MAIADMSAFAKSLRDQIDRLEHAPSHVEMLNLLSRAAGYRNFQQLRAQAQQEVAAPLAPSPVIERSSSQPQADEVRVMRTLRVYDQAGRIVRWPSKRSQQEICLWFLWSKIPPRRSFGEREISHFLDGLHLFEDPALLRRDLVDLRLMTRNRDGSDYRRVEREPPPELKLLLSKVAGGAKKAA